MKNNLKKVLLLTSSLPMMLGVVSCKNDVIKEKEIARTYIGDMLDMDTDYEIVIPQRYTDAQEYAANELVNYFSKVTGKNLNVVTDNTVFASKKTTYISLGNTTIFNKANREHPMDVSEETLNTDGFVMYTYGTNIIINGFIDRGTLYGVYEFLEDTLGIKFLNYRYDHIPTLHKVELYSYDKTYVPVFQQRAFLNTPVFDKNQTYVTHMRFNTDYCPVDSSKGGYTEWCSFNGNTSHTMLEIIPRRNYLVTGIKDSLGHDLIEEDYREIFAHSGSGSGLIQEWASEDNLDYCFTNGVNDDGSYDGTNEINTVKMTVESLKKWILDNPNCENYMIGQADTPGGCPCDKCRQAAEKYKGGGRMVRFINLVNRQIQEWAKEACPDRHIKFTMFAYLYTLDAPINEQGNVIDNTCIPDPEVYVKYAPINTATYYSFDDPRQPTHDAYENLALWSKITDRFHAWTYHSWYGNWLWYYPTLQALQPTMKAMLDAGVVYQFAQGAYTENNLYQEDLDAYVFSNLCWDMNASVLDLRNEYVRYFFGEDAYDDVIKFHDILESRYAYIESKGDNMTATNKLCKSEYWPDVVTRSLVQCFDDAVEKTNANPNLSEEQKATFTESLLRASLSPRWMRLSMLSGYPGVNEEDVSAYAKEFVELAERYGFKQYAEGNGYNLNHIKEMYNIN